MRTVEILVDNVWSKINFDEIAIGDTFRMFEPTGEPVVGNNKETEFICTSSVFDYEGTPAVHINDP